MGSEIMTLDSIEKYICSIIGKDNFSAYSNFLFESAFQEAPYLGIDRTGEEFKSFANGERAAGMTELYNSINEGRIDSETIFEFPGEMQIKVAFRREYFKNLSPEDIALEFEPYVRRVFGKKNFNNLENWVFDYACKEADYFEKRSGKDFDRIVKLRRGKTILDVAETIDDEKLHETKVVLPDEKAMNKMLEGQLKSDCLVSLEMNSNVLLPIIHHFNELGYFGEYNTR